LDPGWVLIGLGRPGGTDDIDAAIENYVALAEGRLQGSGKHWYHSEERSNHEACSDERTQEKLVKELEEISGVKVPT
jgi:hypothetical protein